MKTTEEKWVERIREWKASGLTAKEFTEGKPYRASSLVWRQWQLQRGREVSAAVRDKFAGGRVKGGNTEGTGRALVTRRIFLAVCPAAPDGWEHLRTLIRIDTDTFDRLGQPNTETFYYISSLAIDRLSPEQWLTTIRRHWAVETVHQILDGAFAEDDRPWVLENPRLTLVVMILRRIGYTLLTIFRSITQRSDDRRQQPWHCLLQRIRDAVLLATPSVLDGLRPRTPSAASANG